MGGGSHLHRVREQVGSAMNNDMLRIEVSDTHTLHVPANRVRLTDLRIEGEVWTYELKIGQPEEDEL